MILNHLLLGHTKIALAAYLCDTPHNIPTLV